jgi:hypothetical protein
VKEFRKNRTGNKINLHADTDGKSQSKNPDNTADLSLGTKIFIWLENLQTLCICDIYDMSPDLTYRAEAFDWLLLPGGKLLQIVCGHCIAVCSQK